MYVSRFFGSFVSQTSCPQDLFGGVGAPCSSSLAGPESDLTPTIMEVENGSLQKDSFFTIGPFPTSMIFHDYGKMVCLQLFLEMFETSWHIKSDVHGCRTTPQDLSNVGAMQSHNETSSWVSCRIPARMMKMNHFDGLLDFSRAFGRTCAYVLSAHLFVWSLE